MPALSLCVRSGIASCEIVGRADVLNLVIEAAAPYLTPGVIATPGYSWRVVAQVDSRARSAHSLDDLAGQVQVDGANRHLKLVAATPRHAAHAALRQIRHVLRLQDQAQGWPVVHGALVDVAGEGILVAGEKRSGKTSLVSAMLARSDCCLVSNDDTSLRPNGDGLIGFGWPRSARIRRETAFAMAHALKARARSIRSEHPYNPGLELPAGLETFQKSVIHLSTTDLAQAFTIRASAAVKVVVFPNVQDGCQNPQMTELSRTAGMERMKALSTPESEVPGIQQMRHLARYFARPSSALLGSHLAAVRHCRFFSVTHSFVSLLQAAEDILQLVSK